MKHKFQWQRLCHKFFPRIATYSVFWVAVVAILYSIFFSPSVPNFAHSQKCGRWSRWIRAGWGRLRAYLYAQRIFPAKVAQLYLFQRDMGNGKIWLSLIWRDGAERKFGEGINCTLFSLGQYVAGWVEDVRGCSIALGLHAVPAGPDRSVPERNGLRKRGESENNKRFICDSKLTDGPSIGWGMLLIRLEACKSGRWGGGITVVVGGAGVAIGTSVPSCKMRAEGNLWI